jgi:hypothetical protein
MWWWNLKLYWKYGNRSVTYWEFGLYVERKRTDPLHYLNGIDIDIIILNLLTCGNYKNIPAMHSTWIWLGSWSKSTLVSKVIFDSVTIPWTCCFVVCGCEGNFTSLIFHEIVDDGFEMLKLFVLLIYQIEIKPRMTS